MPTICESRKVTTKLIEAVDEGVLSWEDLAKACLHYMPEAEVVEMAELHDLTYFDGT